MSSKIEERVEIARSFYDEMRAKIVELEKHLAFMSEHPPQEAAERIAELEKENLALREHYGYAQVEIQRLNDELKGEEENQQAQDKSLEAYRTDALSDQKFIKKLREEIMSLESEAKQLRETNVRESREIEAAYEESRRLGYQEGLASRPSNEEVAYLRSLVDRLVDKT